MNVKILLIAVAAVSLASCSTAYRSGQTPDDVYFSPVRTTEERNDREEDRRDHTADAEEREIRMSSRDRRWRDWDNDYDCRYDPYRYGYSYGYYYNPYYYPFPVYSGYTFVNPKNTTPRMGNLAAYNPKTPLIVKDPKTGSSKWNNNPRVTNSNNNGGLVRRILTPSADRNSSNNNSNRTYNPSSSGSSSGSSGTRSTGAPVSRPARGN